MILTVIACEFTSGNTLCIAFVYYLLIYYLLQLITILHYKENIATYGVDCESIIMQN